jgi:DNA-binding Lrp family transcriptional regulator
MKLDRIDFEILASLQANARMSNKDLATANKISPSTCLERVRRLNRIGAIKGYHADVSPETLGIGVQAMISIRLRQHAHIEFRSLIEQIMKIREVVNVYLLAGAQDFMVHVAVKDVAHLRTLVVDTFTSRDDVDHIETSLIFEFGHSPVLPNYRSEQEPNHRSTS